MEHAKRSKGGIDLLLFTSWDRFSRNIMDAYGVMEKLKKMNIIPQAIEQPIDLTIPENKAILAMFLVIPEIDNDRRSIKTRGGINAALKAGRWCRRAPYGYNNTRDELNKPY
jgi:site-specific DNA recombinase